VTDDPNDLDGLFEQRAGEDGPPDPVDHPGSEVLSAYSAQALPPEEELRVQEHLAVCKRCRDLLLDFASFLETPLAERTEGVTDLAAAAEWRALRERMRRESGGSEEPRTRAPGRDNRLVRTLRVFQTLAAVLGVLVVGQLLYGVWHNSRPLQFLPEKTLSITENRGLGSLAEEIRPPVALRIPTGVDYPVYRIEILTEDGRRLYSAKTSFSEIILPLNRGDLAAGVYEIRVLGLKDGRTESVGDPKKIRIPT
jgi:hypothetical protein